MKNILILFILLSLVACTKRVASTTGSACTVKAYPQGALISCPNGDSTFISNGVAGVNGNAGIDGTSCHTEQLINGSKISCTDGSFSYVYNGEDGLDAPQGLMIRGYIFVCGTEFDNDEIFLRLTNGDIIAVFDGGNYLSRLVKLAPGSYITTDRTGTNCNVHVDSKLNVTSTPTATTGEALSGL